ncbi:hypothetical protein QBC39DRAFT_373491 [Podospora conica]|nr:hypothetical protein QBC39DRAFT_373491 [Schizothecium conicum]
MEFDRQHLRVLPDPEDFELKKGYMRALIQFAEDGVIRDTDSDADSTVSKRAGGGNANTLAPPGRTYISCRISSVPAFTWPDDAVQPPDSDADSRAADTDSVLSASTAQSPGPLQETFPSLTLTTSKDLPPTGLRPPPHPSRKSKPAANPLSLRTVQEETPRRSISATPSPVTSLLTAIPFGRPSTSSLSPSSTTPRLQSLRHKRSTSPRRSSGESLFRLFRPSTARDDPPPTFLERRTLTPHERLAPVPRGQGHDIPPVPTIPPPSRWELTPVPTQEESGKSVFGIPLDESVALAPMRIRVSHKGSAVSHRSVPVGVYRCCEYIRRTGPHAPTLFGPRTLRAEAVAALRGVFDAGPGYGGDFDFEADGDGEGGGYAPADAAHLVLVYLGALPKPLVPESVMKSWIVLCRRHDAQGGGGGGGGMEESGLDFWAEALNRLGTMERNLVKLLLEVFAVVLGEADAGGEEERGLAGDVAGAMFQLALHAGGEEGGGGLLRRMSGSRSRRKEGRGREAVVALGFLVRRRGEYLRGLATGGGGEGGFLPSVGEVKGWKGKG